MSAVTVRFLINPAAGPRGLRRRRLERLGALAREAGVEPELTESADHLFRLARAAAEAGVERLLVAGGDGSVHHAVQGIAGSATALGVVPAGTGNDFATAIGAPSEPGPAIRRALAAPVRRVDLGRAWLTGAPAAPVWFSTYAGLGFDGEVARRAHQYHRVLSGNAIYVWAVLTTLADFKPPVVTVEHDGGRFHGPAMFVTLANGPAFGGGMRIAPDARNDDGVLDLVIVKAIPRRVLLAVFPKVYAGRHVGHPAVEIVRTRNARFEVDREMTAWADGEPTLPAGPGGDSVELEVVPGALAICGG